MSFRVVPLPLENFRALFGLSAAELARRGVRRVTADTFPGFPCRVSLEDAPVDEQLLLLNFQHQPIETPYRASGPIYVRENAIEARPVPGEIPQVVACRTISVRAYDEQGMMKEGRVVKGDALRDCFAGLFGDSTVSYLHLHNAGAGCYSCRVERA